MAVAKIAEKDLDRAFAEEFQVNLELQAWLLAGGRFARFANEAELLIDEQLAARKRAEFWWRHWWCKLPDGSESETDLFFVFSCTMGRFAIHVENKPAHGLLKIDQSSSYRRRAVFMANTEKWLNYSDFETIILAPDSFIEANSESIAQFDRSIGYESVARFVPMFGAALP